MQYTSDIKKVEIILDSIESLYESNNLFIKENYKTIINLLKEKKLYDEFLIDFDKCILDTVLSLSYFYNGDLDKSYNYSYDTLILFENNKVNNFDKTKLLLINILVQQFKINKDYIKFENTIDSICKYNYQNNLKEQIPTLIKEVIYLIVNNYENLTDLASNFINYTLNSIPEFDIKILNEIYSAIGKCYSRVFNNRKKAVDYFMKAIDFARLENDISSEISNINALAVEYLLLDDKDKAFEVLNNLLSKDIYKENMTTLTKGIILVNMIEVKLAQHHFDESKYYLELLSKHIDNISHGSEKEQVLRYYELLKGEYFNSINKSDLALDILLKHVELKYNNSQVVSSPDSYFNTLSNIGIAYLNKKEYDESLKFFVQASELEDKLGLNNTRFEPLQYMYKIYKIYRDFEKALQCLEKMHHKAKLKNQIIYNNSLEFIYEKFELQDKNDEIQTLQEMNQLDGLTNILNRRYIEDELPKYIDAATCNKPLSVMMLDIDYFKNYNDSYGHLKGDYVLQKVSAELDGLCKNRGNILSRYGGEEFLIICPNINESNLEIFSTEIKNKIEELTIEHKSSLVSDILTLSIGGATIYKPIEKDYLLTNVDKALYISKMSGRNRYTHFTNPDNTTYELTKNNN